MKDSWILAVVGGLVVPLVVIGIVASSGPPKQTLGCRCTMGCQCDKDCACKPGEKCAVWCDCVKAAKPCCPPKAKVGDRE